MKLLRLALPILFTLSAFAVVAQPTINIKKSGHIDSAGIFKLIYVPIEIPEGIAEIRVKELYSDQGKNVLNLGIYDSEGYESGNTTGFRGWSGGAKTEVFISGSDASTGYVPGKIKSGTWHILIYPSTIISNGIDWTLAITLIPGEPKNVFKKIPAKRSINHIPGWYHGDLHMHTRHSDGKRTQQELVDEALNKKLDFIISTEHNTNSANLLWGKYNNNDLLIIDGEEVTTTAFGHWNAIGINTNTVIDWRYSPGDNVIGKYLNQVHQDSGLAIINHPFYAKNRANTFAFDPLLFDGIEVWNGNWDLMDADALKWWDGLLKQGKHLIAIGASDTHKSMGSENNLGMPQTVVYAESLSKKAILTGLRTGKAFITAQNTVNISFSAKNNAKIAQIGDTLMVKKGNQISISLVVKSVDNAMITLIGDQGIIASEKAVKIQHQWNIKAGSSKYIRVEIRTDEGKMLALTNPIWLVTL